MRMRPYQQRQTDVYGVAPTAWKASVVMEGGRGAESGGNEGGIDDGRARMLHVEWSEPTDDERKLGGLGSLLFHVVISPNIVVRVTRGKFW